VLVNIVNDEGAQQREYIIYNSRDGYVWLCLSAWVAVVEQGPNLVEVFLVKGDICRIQEHKLELFHEVSIVDFRGV